jgi:hypothetical protein
MSKEITIKCKSESDAVKLNMLVELVDNGFVGQNGFKSWERKDNQFTFTLRD